MKEITLPFNLKHITFHYVDITAVTSNFLKFRFKFLLFMNIVDQSRSGDLDVFLIAGSFL